MTSIGSSTSSTSAPGFNYKELGIKGKKQLGGEDLKTNKIDYTDGLSAAELKKIDTNNDGIITEQEFNVAMKGDPRTKEIWNSITNFAIASSHKNSDNTTSVLQNSDGKSITTTFDADGKPTKTSVTDGQTTNITEGNKKTTIVINDDGTKTETIKDGKKTTTNTYDTNNNLTKTVEKEGNTTITTIPNDDGTKTETVKKGNTTTTNIYDANNKLTETSVKKGNTTTTTKYDSNGAKTEQIVDKGNGNLTTTKYTGSKGSEQPQTEKTTNYGRETSKTEWSYDGTKSTSVTTKENGEVITTNYENGKMVNTKTEKDGKVKKSTENIVNDEGNTVETKKNGSTTTITTKNANGDVVSVEQKYGSKTTLITEYSVNENGEKVTTKTSNSSNTKTVTTECADGTKPYIKTSTKDGSIIEECSYKANEDGTFTKTVIDHKNNKKTVTILQGEQVTSGDTTSYALKKKGGKEVVISSETTSIDGKTNISSYSQSVNDEGNTITTSTDYVKDTKTETVKDGKNTLSVDETSADGSTQIKHTDNTYEGSTKTNSKVTTPTVTNDITYVTEGNAKGKPLTKVITENGVTKTEEYEYFANGSIKSVTTKDSDGKVISTKNYDANGKEVTTDVSSRLSALAKSNPSYKTTLEDAEVADFVQSNPVILDLMESYPGLIGNLSSPYNAVQIVKSVYGDEASKITDPKTGIEYTYNPTSTTISRYDPKTKMEEITYPTKLFYISSSDGLVGVSMRHGIYPTRTIDHKKGITTTTNLHSGSISTYNQRTGVTTETNLDGEVTSTSYTKTNADKSKTTTTYNLNGQPTYVETVDKNGEALYHKSVEYYDNGKIHEETEYNFDKTADYEVKRTVYNEDGSKTENITDKTGKAICIKYDAEGKEISREVVPHYDL